MKVEAKYSSSFDIRRPEAKFTGNFKGHILLPVHPISHRNDAYITEKALRREVLAFMPDQQLEKKAP